MNEEKGVHIMRGWHDGMIAGVCDPDEASLREADMVVHV